MKNNLLNYGLSTYVSLQQRALQYLDVSLTAHAYSTANYCPKKFG